MITRTYIKTYRTLPDPDYFHIENLYNGNNTLTLTKNGTPASTDLQYRMGDDGEWTYVDLTQSKTTYVLAAGGKVYFRSTTGFSKDNSNYFGFSSSSNIAAHGDIVSLFNYLETGKPFAIPNYSCYKMFYNCTALTTAPDLSNVTSIDNYGCQYMFYYCSALTTAPDLSNVKSIGTTGCSNMFNGCASLNYVYAPSPSSWNTSSMSSWLNNVASYGIVRKKSTLTIPTDSASGIPTGWDVENY